MIRKGVKRMIRIVKRYMGNREIGRDSLMKTPVDSARIAQIIDRVRAR